MIGKIREHSIFHLEDGHVNHAKHATFLDNEGKLKWPEAMQYQYIGDILNLNKAVQKILHGTVWLTTGKGELSCSIIKHLFFIQVHNTTFIIVYC